MLLRLAAASGFESGFPSDILANAWTNTFVYGEAGALVAGLMWNLLPNCSVPTLRRAPRGAPIQGFEVKRGRTTSASSV